MSSPTPPDARPTRVGVVGAGRVGAVLGATLQAAGHQVVAAYAGSGASRDRVARLLPGVPLREPVAVAYDCDLLLLSVPDDVVSDVASGLVTSGAVHAGQVVVHTSGRHGLAALDSVLAAGARPVALHPALTFTGTAADLDRLAGCAFGATAGTGEWDVVERLVGDLGGHVVWVAEEDRALYHAGLAHGANHLVTLVSQARDLLSTAGVTDPAGTLRPLLEAALDNSLRDGDRALTGPVVRGDVETVRTHFAEVGRRVADALPSYAALARATLDRVVTDGRVAPRTAAAIAGALDEADSRPRGVR